MEEDGPVQDKQVLFWHGLGAKKWSSYLMWQIWEESFQWALKIFTNKIKRWSNLNAGTGKPCAGHSRLKLSNSFLTKSDSFVSDENLGIDPLIGSEGEESILPFFL